MTETATQNLPLFYRAPQPLSPSLHGRLRVRGGDYAFAADSAYTPVLVGEFPFAARDYPILFAGEKATPLALMGLQQRNLFVSDGRWSDDAYVPAYIRRYPFTTIRLQNDKGFAMVIDADSDRVLTDAAGEGAALFDGEAPSAFTQQALAFCEQFHADALFTEAFSAALVEQDLLIERRADVTMLGGERLGVDGFRIVDAGKFAMLKDAIVVDWHRKGWIGAIHFHLASLERFHNLLRMKVAN